jgi:hypothetical protein
VEKKTGIWIKKLTKKEVSLLNKNVAIFAFFLFLAFIFWYINSLSKELKSDFKFSANFINAPKGRVISGDLPLKLTLELKGQGYSLLKRKIYWNIDPLVIDLSKVTFRRMPDSKPTRYYVLSATLIPGFKKQMENGFEVLSVKPDTIYLTFNQVENVPDKKVR